MNFTDNLNLLTKKLFTSFILLGLISSNCFASSSEIEEAVFDDKPLDYALELPDWFKLSFLELETDIQEAKEQNKKGIIIYFGQKYCAYCKAHLERNWGQ